MGWLYVWQYYELGAWERLHKQRNLVLNIYNCMKHNLSGSARPQTNLKCRLDIAYGSRNLAAVASTLVKETQTP